MEKVRNAELVDVITKMCVSLAVMGLREEQNVIYNVENNVKEVPAQTKTL